MSAMYIQFMTNIQKETLSTFYLDNKSVFSAW